MRFLMASLLLLSVLLALVSSMLVAHVVSPDERADLVEVAVSVKGDLQLSKQVNSIANPAAAAKRSDAATVPGGSGAGDAQLDQSLPANPAQESTEHQQQQHVGSPQRAEQAKLAKTALAKELEALELMIKLQEKKLALLEKIRSKALNEPDVESNDSNTHVKPKLFREQFGDLLERQIEAMTASAVQDLLDASGQTNAFDTLFVAKALIPMKRRIAGMQMMKLRAMGHQELLVVAFADGAIEFYLSPALLLLRIEPTEQQGLPIRSLELDLHSDLPSLAIIYEQSQVAVYALELTENGRHLMGNQPDNATAIPVDTTTVFSSKINFSSEINAPLALKVAQLAVIQLSSVPKALAITKTARRSVLSIGSEDGGLEFFALNGTLLHKLATNASIQTMATQRNLVAFNNGSDAVLLPLVRGRDAAFVVCQGSTGQVTSIAFDPLHSDLIYAGTSHGEVLVYSARSSGGPPSPPSSSSTTSGSCKVVSRVLLLKSEPLSRNSPRKQQQHVHNPTKVFAIKGYVIASSGSSVTVYNVSRAVSDRAVSMEVVCTLQTSEYAYEDNGKLAYQPLLAVSEGSFVTNIALVVLNHETSEQNMGFDSDIRVFQSLLSNKIEKTDTSWIGFLYIGIIIMVVLVFQFCFRKQHNHSSHLPPSDFDPWGARNTNRSAASAAAATAGGPRGASYGIGDSSRYTQDGRFDLEYLSQEMKANMSCRTARDARSFNASVNTAGGEAPNGASLSDRERFGPSYDELSDDLKRKIAEARKETLECAFDDDYEDEEEEVDRF